MNEGEALARLADIEIVAPSQSLLWPWWLLAFALAGIALAFAWRRRRAAHAPERAALRQIMAAERAWRAGEIDARTSAYRLATAVRLGLELPQLAPGQPPHGIDERAWREWLDALAAVRYRRDAGAWSENCFAQARRWLKETKQN